MAFVGDTLDRHASPGGGGIAVACGGNRLSWQDLLETTSRVEDALGQLETLLHAAGLAPADRQGCETERLTTLSAAVDAMSARGARGPVAAT